MQMRIAAALSILAVAALVAGCSLTGNDDLKRLVKEASFAGASPYDCEWGSSNFESDPKSWYGCWDYVRGTPRRVSRVVRRRLVAHGFRVTSTRGFRSVYLTAVRGSDTLCVDVLARGFRRGRNTRPSEVNPGRREVFVDIWAVEPRASTIPCSALAPWADE
jgi:hypothetical protein